MLIAVLLFVGCASKKRYQHEYLTPDEYQNESVRGAWDVFKRDYLKADDYNDNTWRDAWEKFKYNYLGAEY